MEVLRLSLALNSPIHQCRILCTSEPIDWWMIELRKVCWTPKSQCALQLIIKSHSGVGSDLYLLSCVFFSIRRRSARSGNVRIMALSTSCTFDRFGNISDRTIFAEFTPILRSQWSTFRNSYLAWSSILRKSSTFNDHGYSNDLHIPILKLTFKYRNQNVKIWKNHPFPTIINITIEG